ncbi:MULTISPECIES: host cell division inhibitor Icd-like protein [Pectobacterium]|uniref:host cell division inhibitor Icd-like protein n=1 Tax=Pectobacterium TaxID=122277 RepID=UPI0015F09636|nr:MULTISPECIES: host cell division inhibitor Icd-like protein [Pectobacterium]MBA5227653.1 host cell division inhibitor Icd-like protein [Pectobacterium aroidearum]MBA5735782.1 host cell division inhibitor Icd-like protein [Pectobacterium aroidearum]UXK01953.1 host cell division inhibitor Icd-like protein [Pectobacterium aroidearum]
MADSQSTQTRLKFQYRFLVLPYSPQEKTFCRLSVEAYSEREARQMLSPCFAFTFAARLPVQEVRHV